MTEEEEEKKVKKEVIPLRMFSPSKKGVGLKPTLKRTPSFDPSKERCWADQHRPSIHDASTSDPSQSARTAQMMTEDKRQEVPKPEAPKPYKFLVQSEDIEAKSKRRSSLVAHEEANFADKVHSWQWKINQEMGTDHQESKAHKSTSRSNRTILKVPVKRLACEHNIVH